MADKSGIEWCDATWNPVTGCSKISPGCKFCYAHPLSLRLQKMGSPRYAAGFDVATHPETLSIPFRWKAPRRIFVNSMSDLFHDEVPLEFILQVNDVVAQNPQHAFMVLTKRPERALELSDHINWTPNLWLGASLESPAYAHRIDTLAEIPAQLRFLSMEPLLADFPNLNLDPIDWVIVGGESGPTPRPMRQSWAESILNHCQRNDVLFFFKQWGGRNKKAAGRELLGRYWNDLPAMPRIVPTPQTAAA